MISCARVAQRQKNFQLSFHSGGEIFQFFIERQLKAAAARHEGIAVKIPVEMIHNGEEYL